MNGVIGRAVRRQIDDMLRRSFWTPWVVRDAVRTATNGNGVWCWCWTRRAAERVRQEIVAGRWRGCFYLLPEDGLVVVRRSQVFR